MFRRFHLPTLAVAAGLVCLTGFSVPQLRADQFDNKTIMTFSGPFEIGGKALAPGSYVFRTLRDDSRVVEVMNRNENHLIALLMTVPASTSRIPDKTRVEFAEGPAQAPAVMRKWFYPGKSTGWEFLNPLSR